MYRTMADIIDANNTRTDQRWFGESQMGFFNTQLYEDSLDLQTVFPKHNGRNESLFITSEQYKAAPIGYKFGAKDGPRRFTVRLCDERGIIHTVGRFQQYHTLEQALDACKGMSP